MIRPSSKYRFSRLRSFLLRYGTVSSAVVGVIVAGAIVALLVTGRVLATTSLRILTSSVSFLMLELRLSSPTLNALVRSTIAEVCFTKPRSKLFARLDSLEITAFKSFLESFFTSSSEVKSGLVSSAIG